ncbi:hypothetical protein G7Y89_g8258 [Cudoniella acicularis]|uniref:Carbonic anhydrase n=1 Tax=Cudoniella acicularis TaxID=354080 RepID=A0A8H4W309_9HELO|nr:hypothetical protein G7Y89_g8258 [Cudoniella acicularis]
MFLEKPAQNVLYPPLSAAHDKLDTSRQIAAVMATDFAMPVQQFTASPSQYTLYNSQSQSQPISPINSATATPNNASPTSPRTALPPHLPAHTRQLRPPKSPLYVPAVLRPTDPPRRATKPSPLTPPQSMHGSFDDLENARTLKRRSTDDGGKLGLGSIVEAEWSTEGLAKVTALPTRDHWKPDSESAVCDEPACTSRSNSESSQGDPETPTTPTVSCAGNDKTFKLELIVSREKWAENPGYTPPVGFKEMQRRGREREDGTVIVVACTDPRVTPEEFMGMSSEKGNKATIIRTAGGRVHSALNTLLVLSAVGNLGKKGTIIVVHHTDCGLQSVDDEEIRRVLRAGLDNGGSEEGKGLLEGTSFGSFEDPEKSVKEDVKTLRESPFFKGMGIVGLVQDTETGLMREVI